jgi:hypothetical protein
MIVIDGTQFVEYIEKADKPVFTITKGDIQLEAQRRLGRLLAHDDIDAIAGCLEWGVGESINITYTSALQDL